MARPPEPTREEIEISRVRLPQSPEVLGIVETMLGGDHVKANCTDGNVRVCRIPGRLRKRVWINPGNLILVKPWVVQSNIRGDVAFVYTPTQANYLKRKGYY
ncbi:MAG TPA: translation initiation factor eIF-1A [archaeon]|nr:translation initiation factor eIF-1A [archaeon]